MIDTIKKQLKNKAKHWHTAERVREIISETFKDVKLGNGVGLKKANGLDDRVDTITFTELRATDEKGDWRKIPVSELNRCHSSLSFFDAEGVRFHLPAFLIAELNGDDLANRGSYCFDMVSRLTNITDWQENKFSLLSKQQRDAVREFLNCAIEDEESQHHLTSIIKVLLEGYWRE